MGTKPKDQKTKIFSGNDISKIRISSTEDQKMDDPSTNAQDYSWEKEFEENFILKQHKNYFENWFHEDIYDDLGQGYMSVSIGAIKAFIHSQILKSNIQTSKELIEKIRTAAGDTQYTFANQPGSFVSYEILKDILDKLEEGLKDE